MQQPIFPERPQLFERIGFYPGTFDPPLHHREILKLLAQVTEFDRLIVLPIGHYEGKQPIASCAHRKAMCEIMFSDIVMHNGRKVKVIYDDLDHDRFTSNFGWQSQNVFEWRPDLAPSFLGLQGAIGTVRDIWHIVSIDNIVEDVRIRWNEGQLMLDRARFFILKRPGYSNDRPLPTNLILFEADVVGASRDFRGVAWKTDGWEELVSKPELLAYIMRNGLYRP